jgi:hypothetical protein
MALGASFEGGVTADAAARARRANWERVRQFADRLGDTWDVENSTFELLCECGRPACRANVPVALADYVAARTNGHDVVSRYHEDPLDLVVEAVDGYRVVARQVANGGSTASGGVADWTCGCGQEYRVAVRGPRVVLWPRNSRSGYRTEPIGDTCVNGCAIDALAVLHALVAPAYAA